MPPLVVVVLLVLVVLVLLLHGLSPVTSRGLRAEREKKKVHGHHVDLLPSLVRTSELVPPQPG